MISPARTARQRQKKAPRRMSGAGRFGSVAGVPDDGVGVVIILPGSTPEVGVESATAEFGGRHGEPDIFAAGHLAGANPSAAELDTRGQDAVIGLVAGLAAVGKNDDLGIDRQRLQRAAERTVVLALHMTACRDRTRDVSGKRVLVRVDTGGRR